LLVATDSKDFHDSNEISRNLRKWLNHCWAEETKRVASTLSEPRPFTKRKMPVVFPSGKTVESFYFLLL
jgi:predicted Zn-dependent protease